MCESIVKSVERLGVQLRLREGKLQVRELLPGAKDRARPEILRQSNLIIEELEAQHLPRIDVHGNLVIPTNAPLKYRWWQDGQSIRDTLLELRVPNQVWRRYVEDPYSGEQKDVVE